MLRHGLLLVQVDTPRQVQAFRNGLLVGVAFAARVDDPGTGWYVRFSGGVARQVPGRVEALAALTGCPGGGCCGE